MNKRIASTPPEELQHQQSEGESAAAQAAAPGNTAVTIDASSSSASAIVSQQAADASAATSAASSAPLPAQRLGVKRVRRSPSRLNPFTLLSSVEVQLVLQQLDNRSRLAAAVTSRRMMSEAMQPFSWKYGQLVTVTTKQLQQQQHRALPACSLLQLAPIQINMGYNSLSMRQVLRMLGNVRRLFCIKVTSSSNSRHVSLAPLLQHPAAQRLQQLQLNFTPSVEIDDFIGALPHLTSCSVGRWDETNATSVPRLTAQLALHESFTELGLRGSWSNSEAAVEFAQVFQAQPSSIRRLHLEVCGGLRPRFDTLFSSPGLAQLQLLSLFFLSAAHTPSDAIRRGFVALRQLHTLQLLFPTSVDELLALVSAAPALSQLRLWCLSDVHALPSSLPSAQALSVLQTALPQLRTSITSVESAYHGQSADTQRLTAYAQVERVTVINMPLTFEFDLLLGPNERI